MSDVKIAILGGSGRMGRMLIRTVLDAKGAALAAVTERPESDWISRDAGEAIGGAPLGVTVTANAEDALRAADAAIDFTSPDATVAHAEVAARLGRVLVIGTTGFEPRHIEALDAAAAAGAVLIRAGNMSLGVNLLTVLAEKVARALDQSFDVEIVESHHRHKVDAPSGTALMLGEAAAKGRGVDLADAAERGRDGITGARAEGAIGFAALRGGDVVGEHDVIFAGPGERVVLRHIATDRAIFARGAVKAALWGQGKPPGAYDMIDVLGLRD
ncbi:MAG: 4-hydroxy-tetrahydrodipicolinate reductase [Pseudomonadota bacterium]